MIERAFSVNVALTRRLFTHLPNPAGSGATRRVLWRDLEIVLDATHGPDPSTPIDVIVTANEINNKHGTGPLVKRLFEARRNLFCIRSKSDWGEQDFGDWSAVVGNAEQARPDWYRNVLRVLGGKRVRSVFCVPYLADELRTSIAIQSCFGADLSMYLMDDQNIIERTIPDDLMREFLGRCSLRLVTHPELRYVYQQKFGLDFFLLPAIVPNRLVTTTPTAPLEEYMESRRGALLGSFWDQGWFDATCEVLAGIGSVIDWYGNNKSPWLTFPAAALERAGIRPLGVVPEPELAARLREYPFVIVPYARLDGRDTNAGVACLSLPGRILFALAAAHTPVLLLGSEKSCGARVVRHLQIGEVAPYTVAGVAGAIERLCDPDQQRELRKNAAVVAERFSDRGIADWLSESIEKREPADDRFEMIFRDYDPAPVAQVLAGLTGSGQG